MTGAFALRLFVHTTCLDAGPKASLSKRAEAQAQSLSEVGIIVGVLSLNNHDP